MKKTDARVVKTLSSIEHAFIGILEQKDYDNITISDILERANINRTTFYRYHKNKNDLAYHIIKKLQAELFKPLLDNRFGLSWEEFSQQVPQLFDKNFNNLSQLWKINTPKTNLREQIYKLIKERYIKEINGRINNIQQNDDLDFQGHLYASFCIAIIEKIINDDKLSNPDYIQHNLKRMFENLILI